MEGQVTGGTRYQRGVPDRPGPAGVQPPRRALSQPGRPLGSLSPQYGINRPTTGLNFLSLSDMNSMNK